MSWIARFLASPRGTSTPSEMCEGDADDAQASGAEETDVGLHTETDPEDDARISEQGGVQRNCGVNYALQPGEFMVDIRKGGEGAGLDLHAINGMLLIARLKDGAITSWNARQIAMSQDPNLMVRVGDRIVHVSGTGGDCYSLLNAMRSNSRLRMVLRHASEVQVTIKKSGRDLGILVISIKRKLDMLLVRTVADGVVLDWNRAHKDQQVLSGDYIVSVNGIRGDPRKMFEELKANDHLEINLIRPW
uniref:PDZ domain-containing protein n=1 Tax=Noctiluca scintillans TaxID=2966 RepID=A0A7S1AY67_NOCSC|mmetsp:Transcript_64017/g.169519  ORF Transcript_64017/g.169519 Transcript_64017/m.169519 type:complete len:247 (+) Transcript_64017:60-800(+)